MQLKILKQKHLVILLIASAKVGSNLEIHGSRIQFLIFLMRHPLEGGGERSILPSVR